MGCITSAPKNAGHGGGRRFGAPRAQDSEIRDRIECSPATVSLQVGTTQLRYAYLSQRGYYPDALNKPNQDCFLVCRNFMRDPNRALFSVFDGHGREGDLCAQFARDLLVEKLGEHLRGRTTEADIKQGISRGFLELNEQLHQNSAIDDTLSGTTAISVIFFGNTLYIANVGDSRAILAQKSATDDGKVQAFPLSDDQTPYRKDERERVKKCGARVLSMDQIAGIEPIHENWGDVKLGEDIDEGGDPPRIWSKYGEYPGTAFTRSLGDSIAEELGVYAVPEITVRTMQPNDAFIVIASDGVFEFLTNQHTVDIIKTHKDPLEACHAVVQEAYELWLQYEVRTDDITLICLYIDSTTPAGAPIDSADGHAVNNKGTATSSNNSNSSAQSQNDKVSPEERPASTSGSALTMQSSRPIRTPRRAQKGTARDGETFDWATMNRDTFEQLKIAKTPEEMASLRQAMMGNFLFRDLSDEKRSSIAEIMIKVPVKAGDLIIRQGDPGDRFYIAESGTYEVRVGKTEEEAASGHGEVVHVYQVREKIRPSFGELALIDQRRRAASIVAVTDGSLWALERVAFRAIFFGSVHQSILQTLRRVQQLQGLRVPHLQQIATRMEQSAKEYKHGDVIAEAGQAGFYMIRQGVAELRDESGEPQQRLRALDFVGETTLCGDSKLLKHTVVAASSPCVAMGLTPTDIGNILGKPLSILIDELDPSRRRQRGISGSGSGGGVPTSSAEVERVGLVAKDEFGGTFLVSWRDGVMADPTLFTMRSASKAALCKAGNGALALKRAEIAKIVSNGRASPFIPPILRTFLEPTSLHELYQGTVVTSLRGLIDREAKQCSDEASLRHVAACVVSILSELHEAQIMFRGVCPELLFLNNFGYIVAMDFRNSKLGLEKTFTVCGTSQSYVAPEQISHVGHTHVVDFWALGVLLLEMILGEEPFIPKDQWPPSQVQTYRTISDFKSISSLKLPSTLSSDLLNLLQAVLTPDPASRLGAQHGVAEVKQHPWFGSVDFEQLQAGRHDNPLRTLVQGRLRDLQSDRQATDEAWAVVQETFEGDDSVFSRF